MSLFEMLKSPFGAMVEKKPVSDRKVMCKTRECGINCVQFTNVSFQFDNEWHFI